mgnify:CR=1 FL=1
MREKTINELKAIMKENKPFYELVVESRGSAFVGSGAYNRSLTYSDARNELIRRGELK